MVKTSKNQSLISWRPVKPVGSSRAKVWPNVTEKMFKELLDHAETLNTVEQKKLLDKYSITLVTLRKKAGIVKPIVKDVVVEESPTLTVEMTIAKMEDKIAEHQKAIDELQLNISKLKNIDQDMFDAIAAMVKL